MSMFKAHSFRAESLRQIKEGIATHLIGEYAGLLPSSKDARILLKPNLNANMNALTGNTTDLRLLAAVIEALKDTGYHNITIGEGTNSGFYRNRISVIARLGIDRLAGYYGVKYKDLNYATPHEIEFQDGVRASVARDCVEAELFINMPKLKTHFEAGMSVCLKNLMGCLIGQDNKKKTHKALSANILNITKAIKPHLHIIDALVSMEGLGPTRGTPLRTDTVFMGNDPYVLDLICARFATFPHTEVRTIAEGLRQGVITQEHLRFAREFHLDRAYAFKPPKAGPIATFIHSPRRQKYFLAVRNTAVFNYLCSTKAAGKLLYATGLRQDVFRDDEMVFEGLEFDSTRCTRCGKCSEYCPIGLELPASLPEAPGQCVDCLYCFCICPQSAITFTGELGFLEEQLAQYDTIIRRMA